MGHGPNLISIFNLSGCVIQKLIMALLSHTVTLAHRRLFMAIYELWAEHTALFCLSPHLLPLWAFAGHSSSGAALHCNCTVSGLSWVEPMAVQRFLCEPISWMLDNKRQGDQRDPLFLAVLQCHTPMGELVVPLDNQRAGWRSVSVSIKLKVQNKTLFIVLFIHMYQIHKSTNIFSSSDFGSQMNIKWTNDIHTLPSHHYNFKSPFSLSYATSNSMGRVFQFLTWQKHSFCET